MDAVRRQAGKLLHYSASDFYLPIYAETCEALGLPQMKGRKWHVQGAIATRGEGLYEGLDWLSATLKQMNRGTQPAPRK